jgi:chromate reductase, NAD(P)H dehydrogenase (quinone)
MASNRILLIGGSLRPGSTNAAALKTAQALMPPGTTAVIYERLADLPHFNPDDDRMPLPEPVAHLRAELAAADGVVFSTPEYAGSLPGSFKNLLDWTVGDGLHRKPVGWINASAHGAAKGAYATLGIVLGYVAADVVADACVNVMVRRDAITADGTCADPNVRAAIAAALAVLMQHVASQALAAL